MPKLPELPSHRVRRELLAMLYRMETGQQLPPVQALADTLSTSGVTVRKVLKQLESDGQVEIIPNYGTFKK